MELMMLPKQRTLVSGKSLKMTFAYICMKFDPHWMYVNLYCALWKNTATTTRKKKINKTGIHHTTS